MDNNFIDYFEILQVHFLAEERMIKNAYIKLCHLYHPDNSKNYSDEKMYLINEAYSVLSHPQLKKEYIKSWINQYSDGIILAGNSLDISMYDFAIQPLKKMVLEYMYLIKVKKFEMAYQMISDENKNKIFKKDFILWQRLVSEIYELIDFDCTFSKLSSFNSNNIIEFKVKIIEKNMLLERIEEDFFARKLIYNQGKWSIYLGNPDLKEIINKYKRIIRINKKNTIAKKKYLKEIGADYRTGFLSKKFFLHNCEFENYRHLRYQNVFSIISFEINIDKFSNIYRNEVIQMVGNLLKKNSRKLDSFCYLKRGVFLMLLPETNVKKAELYGKKIISLINDNSNFLIDNKKVIIEYIANQQEYSSIKELLKRLRRVN